MSTSGKPLIVVTGCTGHQGGSLIDALLKRNTYRIIGLCRHLEGDKAKVLKEKGVQLIHCDLSKKHEIVEALNGVENIYGMFGVTQFWQDDVLKDHNLEIIQGKNMVDVCLEKGINHFIWSSLDDAENISQNKYDIPHFTNKNKVEQYAREHKSLRCSFVYPSAFFQNFLSMIHIEKNASSGELLCMCNEQTKVPMFDVNDIGEVVASIFDMKNEYVGKKILVASELLTYPRVAKIFSEELQLPVKYRKLDEQSCRKKFGNEMTDMYKYFEEFGYYQDQENAMGEAKKLNPNMKNLREWVKENKKLFLSIQSVE